MHRLDEFGEARIVRIVDRLATRSSRREEQQRVRGRRVAVDGDAIVGQVAQLRDQRLAHIRPKRGVGEQVVQRRRHVGLDHARALGDADDRNAAAVEIDDLARSLGERVGRSDAVGDGLPVRCAQPAPDFLHAPRNDGRRQRLADHARRGDKDFMWIAARHFYRRRNGGVVLGDARSARESVGVAGVDHQHARPALARLQRCAAAVHIIGPGGRFREDAPDRCAFREVHDQKVIPHLALVETERMRRDLDASHNGENRKTLGRERRDRQVSRGGQGVSNLLRS